MLTTTTTAKKGSATYQLLFCFFPGQSFALVSLTPWNNFVETESKPSFFLNFQFKKKRNMAKWMVVQFCQVAVQCVSDVQQAAALLGRCSIFIPPRAREFLQLHDDPLQHHHLISQIGLFFPSYLFFLTGTFICLICTAYPSVSFFLPLSIVFFFYFLPFKKEKKNLFSFLIVSRAAFFNPISFPAYLKAPSNVL